MKRIITLFFAFLILSLLAFASLFIGVKDIVPSDLWNNTQAREVFFISRFPRTAALILVGCALSVAGLIMQLITQNKFVEPSTSGATQSASLGIILVTVLYPSASIMTKMIAASLMALFGSFLFLLILRRVSLKSAIIVPLLGMMLGAVIQSLTTFLALHFDLLQSLISWDAGDFSNILRGRYELLWLIGILTILACFSADRFTIIGMGKEFSINVGLNYQLTMIFGLLIVAVISGVVVVVVGTLPFLGLIVPNIVSLIVGDNVRKNIPWICLLGGGIVLLCDILGRLVIMPFEIPAGSIMGVVGAALFLMIILRNRRYVH
ncbi:ABC transporter permease [Neisseria sp. Ec49-e6-T10]|uniref:ABC transporter permease n=1 Tax=Neisseria sp. Ec49-e6-T10 TaxID=3140744 RepID=UPI003EB7B992